MELPILRNNAGHRPGRNSRLPDHCPSRRQYGRHQYVATSPVGQTRPSDRFEPSLTSAQLAGDTANLTREAQTYLVDIGYRGVESVKFRINLRQILDTIGRLRKDRRKVRASTDNAEAQAVDDAPAVEAVSPLRTAVPRLKG